MQPGAWVELATNGMNILSMPNGGTITEYSDEASWDPVRAAFSFLEPRITEALKINSSV